MVIAKCIVGIAEAVHRCFDFGLELHSVPRSKGLDQRVRKGSGACHHLDPRARSLRATPRDHLGKQVDLEARRLQQLRQNGRFAKTRPFVAVAREAQIMPPCEWGQALKEEILRASAETA